MRNASVRPKVQGLVDSDNRPRLGRRLPLVKVALCRTSARTTYVGRTDSTAALAYGPRDYDGFRGQHAGFQRVPRHLRSWA